MISLTQQDYNILKQKYIRKYIKIDLLDFKYNIVDELSGNCISFSNTIDANSDLRRGCSVEMVITDSSFEIKAGSKIFLDRYIRPYVGYENNLTGEIIWYSKGIYLINSPSWRYNGATNVMSFDALDLMSKMTGLRNGYLEGIPTIISQGENVRKAIIDTIALAGFDKYIVEECQTENDYGEMVEQKVPYDIEIDQGGTVYDILTALRDIMPNYEMFFDEDGVFHYQMIPTGDDEPNILDDDMLTELVMDEVINTDFESVKNYIEVYGHTWDVDYYSPSENTTVSGGTITPTFAGLKELQNDTAVGITLPSDIANVDKITIDFLGSNDVVDIYDKPIKELSKDEEWIFQYVAGPILPDGYTQLEYIQSSGTQYIDTGFKPNQDTRVVTKFDMTQTDAAWRKLWGSGSGTYNLDFALWNFGTKKLQSYYGKQTNGGVDITGMSLNVDANKNIWKYSGATITFAKNNFTCAYSMYIFNVNKDNNSQYLPGMMKLYLFKIYDNDVLVRDFIPCKNSSGVIGLYDLVNNQFYQNAGTGSFTAGPEVEQEDKGGPFWRFMGHRQSQATIYDNDPRSPFYVGDPIGSSSVGRIRIVLCGGDYSNIYSDYLAKERAKFELYQRCRLQDSITLTMVPIPWLDVHTMISYATKGGDAPVQYLVKSINADYGSANGTMTVNAIKYYPYYPDDEKGG